MNMKSMSAITNILLASAMMGGGLAQPSSRRGEDIEPTKKEPPIPKGCKKYWFDEYGAYSAYDTGDIVFTCIALSRERAVAKFNKFKQLQTK